MTTINLRNKLLQCCYPIFIQLVSFLANENSKSEVVQYRQIFINSFSEMEQVATNTNIDKAMLQQVKYAVAALVDELILHSSWTGKTEWLGQPLQLYFFSEHLAGEEFFARLDIFRQNCMVYYDLLEIYYICLQLGFSGIYRIRGQEFLQALQVGLYQQIELVRNQQNKRFDNHQIKENNKIIRKVQFFSIGRIVGCCVLSIALIHISFMYAIDKQADRVLNQIHYY